MEQVIISQQRQPLADNPLVTSDTGNCLPCGLKATSDQSFLDGLNLDRSPESLAQFELIQWIRNEGNTSPLRKLKPSLSETDIRNKPLHVSYFNIMGPQYPQYNFQSALPGLVEVPSNEEDMSLTH